MLSIPIATPEILEAIGGCCAQAGVPGLMIYLTGPLGSGKTTFVRGFLRQLGYLGAVKSPTYTLVEPYLIGAQQIYHFDLYRLADPEELDYLGIRDYLDNTMIGLIEWPERGGVWIPAADIHIELSYQLPGRRLQAQAATQSGQEVLQALEAFNAQSLR